MEQSKPFWRMLGSGSFIKAIDEDRENMEEIEYEALKKYIRERKRFYIYGAGVIAYGACVAVGALLDKRCQAYLVSELSGNPTVIDNIPVREFQITELEEQESYILVATPEEYHQGIQERLQSCGWRSYGFLTSHLEYCLMGEYLTKKIGLRRIEDTLLEEESGKRIDICVFMARSHRDKTLCRTYTEVPWVQALQVGAALTERKIAAKRDNVNDNISTQNSVYGELTAAYWIWKNELHDVTGLFHYRRILKVSEWQITAIGYGAADVILPLPFVCYPNAAGQYGRYITEIDQTILREVLREKWPEQFIAAEEVLKTPYLYNYNLVITRKEVYAAYCQWMFPLLFEIQKRSQHFTPKRLPRYLGRIGEVLTSLYFTLQRNKWNIIHAEKVWRI